MATYIRVRGRIVWSRISAVVLAVILTFASVSPAATVDLPLDEFFADTSPPVGATPWLTASFTDDSQPVGTVELTLSTSNLTDAESVTEWYLNLDPDLDPCLLSFSAVTKTGAFTDPDLFYGIDAFQANGDGSYDLLFDFSTMDGAPTRFGVGDAAVYTITYGGVGTFDISSFAFLSFPGGGAGPYYSAAHVVAVGVAEDSAWIAATVPEPASMCLLGLGAILLRKRRRC